MKRPKPKHNEMDVKVFLELSKKKKNSTAPIISKEYDYCTVDEYAKIMKAHPVTVRVWLGKGLIDGAFKVGRHWKIPVQKAV